MPNRSYSLYSKKRENTYRGLGQLPAGANYNTKSSSVLRHEWTATVTQVLALGDYAAVNLLRMVRPATVATASNNFQTPAVNNGSRVEDFMAKIQIKNNSAAAVILDVYEICLSFFDAAIWNLIQTTACPVTQDTTAASANAGEVTYKPMVSTLVLPNSIANYQFVNHFIKHKGQLEFGASGADNSVQEIIIDAVPPKVKRANCGMFWGIVLKLDSDKNNSAMTMLYNKQQKFMEIPNDNALPFLY